MGPPLDSLGALRRLCAYGGLGVGRSAGRSLLGPELGSFGYNQETSWVTAVRGQEWACGGKEVVASDSGAHWGLTDPVMSKMVWIILAVVASSDKVRFVRGVGREV
jgi:hypothetical protein